MNRYRVEVLETRVYNVTYVVSARSRKEAERKVAEGDTVSETDVKCEQVLDRTQLGRAERC